MTVPSVLQMKGFRANRCVVFVAVCGLALGAESFAQGRHNADEKMLAYYRTHSQWTDPGEQAAMLSGVPADVPSIVQVVQGCLIHTALTWLYELKPSPAQDGGATIRRTDELLHRIKLLDEAPLSVHRTKDKRLVVNCRQFAVLTCSILRQKGVPARVRAGYALYTWGRGMYENHWICEYWKPEEHRWVQVDAQLDEPQKKLMHIDFNPLDMPAGRFVSAGEGWQRYREGKVELGVLGLGGKDGWNGIGWGIVMPNVTCDAMALNKMELLPWDVNPYWGKRKDQMSPADLATIDRTATLCSQVDSRWAKLRKFYESRPLLRMPDGFDTN